MDDLVSDFITETREGLEALDSELVRFEQHPEDPETLGGIFRLIHTIKGTCGFLGLMRLQTVAHAAENVLGGFRDGTVAVTPTAVSAVLDTVDLIRALTDSLAETGSEPEGEDSALIARLESVLDGVAAATPSEPALPAPAATLSDDRRSLIERLGGDATLDSAVEMALPKLRGEGGEATPFSSADPDRLQAALRQGLIDVARAQAATGGFAKAVSESAEAELGADLLAQAFDLIGAALLDLDVTDAAVGDLRALALPAEIAAPDLPEPAPAPSSEAPAGPAGPAVDGAGPSQTIRVSVDALEHLMTVVSELVLIRNQLIQTLRLEPESPFAAPLNRLNQVTSELQEGVMTTRMQPISGAWAKLPRLVRDLAQDLGKNIDLVMYGQETELDRQVLELIKDPLTHMIRNAADHGLEDPAERKAAGKPTTGRITLQARHEGGAIVIEAADDGRGLPAEKIKAKAVSTGLITPAQAEQMSDADARSLIFLPGLSTASQVTSVSGRGVGMDVVRTNIEKIGGAIDVASVEGGGTRFTIRIPLTLTIVSALIVECCDERFAIPQSSVIELVSSSGASSASGRAIEYIDGSAVLRLRDRLLPLVSLQSILGLEASGEPSGESCIVVCRVGAFTFGVIVDRVFDTEEIVVKPVATVLRHLKLYSGATILGDGSVILILDPKGMSSEAGAGQGASASQDSAEAAAGTEAPEEPETALLVFRAAGGVLKAAPLASVSRIEEIAAEQIETVRGRAVIQYREALMPVLDAEPERRSDWPSDQRRPLLVFARDDGSVGLLVEEIVDIVHSRLGAVLRGAPDDDSLIINGVAMELVDVAGVSKPAKPRPVEARSVETGSVEAKSVAAKRLLIVDSSAFSQILLRPLLSQAGYEVTVASSPSSALALHAAGERFHLIIADTTQRGPEARALVTALADAREWHRTPLLSLALDGLVAGRTSDVEVLGAVSESVEQMTSAA